MRSLTENDARITFEVRAQKGLLVEADAAVPLGIVLTELITNAVKYAFPAPRSGMIVAQAQRSRPGWVELLIRDNGVGMSTFREGSLGYGLVRSLVQQIRGEIDIRSEAGVAVTIWFRERLEQPSTHQPPPLSPSRGSTANSPR